MSNIHPTAIIHPSAKIDPSTVVGPYAVIGEDVQIGKNNHIGPFCVIENTTMGDNNELIASCFVGVKPQDLSYKGEHTRVVMGNGNKIRECVTIHRSTFVDKPTTLGDNNLLMANSHLAHDVHMGNNCIIANSTGIAGHVIVEDRVVMSGMVGVHQFSRVGTMAMISGGAMIPVDGTVVEGDAFVNEATMTGESQAVHKSAGKSVFAGTILDEGSIVVSVRAVNGNTKIQKIIELIDQSEDLKASIQSKAERLADSIVPYSFLGFGLTLLFTRNVTKAVSILMVDYSCAIKLSTPISVISALREAADRNMTVKGGKYLEEFALADTIVFDKTGTLTKAEPKLEKVIPFNDRSEEEVLRIAACIEEHFPHSMARAIVRGALDRGIDHEEEHADVKYIVAHGIATTLNGERAVIGSKHFVVEDEHVTVSDTEQRRIDELAGAASVIYLGIGGKLAGVLCISDPPRDEAAEAIRMLRERGIKHVAMITGDSQKAAERTAQLLGIDIFYAQVLPEDKHRYVEKMKAEGHRVIMVGDGINDAPALAAANVSVALSDASDIARETADVTLRSEDLRDLAELKDLSIQLMDKIQANYRFIVTFNTALLAAGFFGILTPSTSALLHNMSTMGICAKSMMPLKQHAPAKRS